MKLINYNYGYSLAFGCSIHGKIVMTPDEYEREFRYLRRSRSWYPTYCPWVPGVLRQDDERRAPIPGGFRVNLRVSATDAIARRNALPRYRRANYMIEVTR